MIRTVVLSTVALSLFASTAFATTTINDGYHGGTPNNPNWLGADVIGAPEHWDISKMLVTADPTTGLLTVQIFSQFFDNVGRRGVELGDLFISTDGWNPFGSAPYDNDDYTNGEDWELVAVLDDHGEGLGFGFDEENGTSYLGESGLLSIYFVIPSNIILSDLAGGDDREGQEVQYDTSGQQAVASGRWSITDVMNDPYDVLTLTLDLGPRFFALFSDLGFHWAMTCGNDVIEGGAPVPEPSTVALLGMGMLGLARRRRKAARA